MRKVMLSLVFLAMLGGVCLAGDDLQLMKTMVINNTASQALVTYVNATNETSGIVPGVHKVVGYTVIPNVLTPAQYSAGLYDATNTTNSINNANLFAESQCVVNTTTGEMFPFPKSLASQLAVMQSANTTVIVQYTR